MDPKEITFLQVWELLEGVLEIAQARPPEVTQGDAIQDLYRGAEEEIRKVFTVSLAELLFRQQTYDELASEYITFHI